MFGRSHTGAVRNDSSRSRPCGSIAGLDTFRTALGRVFPVVTREGGRKVGSFAVSPLPPTPSRTHALILETPGAHLHATVRETQTTVLNVPAPGAAQTRTRHRGRVRVPASTPTFGAVTRGQVTSHRPPTTLACPCSLASAAFHIWGRSVDHPARWDRRPRHPTQPSPAVTSGRPSHAPDSGDSGRPAACALVPRGWAPGRRRPSPGAGARAATSDAGTRRALCYQRDRRAVNLSVVLSGDRRGAERQQASGATVDTGQGGAPQTPTVRTRPAV